MRSKLGGALRRELNGVRVSPQLKRRILAEARMPAFRRRPQAWKPALAIAAALAVVVGGLALMLSLRAPNPDVQRSVVAAQGSGGASSAGTPMPSLEPAASATQAPEPPQDVSVSVSLGRDGAVVSMESYPDEGEALLPDEVNLFMYATAFEGGVLALESSYDDAFFAVEPVAFDEDGQIDEIPAADAAEARATLAGVIDDAGFEAWQAEYADDPACGLTCTTLALDVAGVDTQRVDSEGGDVPTGAEYRFIDPNAPGNALALYVLDGDWRSDEVDAAIRLKRLLWQYDGETVRMQTRVLNAPCTALEAGAFRVDAADSAESQPGVSLPVERGGGVLRLEGEAGGANADTGETLFALRIILLEFEQDGMALILEPLEDAGFTARIHAIESPAMTLDARYHPGMAGWIFGSLLDEGDVVDIIDKDGERHAFTFGEIAEMVGVKNAADAPEDGGAEAAPAKGAGDGE